LLNDGSPIGVLVKLEILDSFIESAVLRSSNTGVIGQGEVGRRDVTVTGDE
jgi:hypothetical protein